MGTEDQSHPQQLPDSARDERIQSPHDRLINQTLQQIEAARTLLGNHLPSEIREHLKLQTLSPADTSFIDPNLRRRFADRLFSIEVADEVVTSLGLKSNFVYLFVLIDHKSTDDPHTLIQMLGYIIRICDPNLRECASQWQAAGSHFALGDLQRRRALASPSQFGGFNSGSRDLAAICTIF